MFLKSCFCMCVEVVLDKFELYGLNHVMSEIFHFSSFNP